MIVGSAPTSNPQGPHRPRFDEARGTRSGSGTGAPQASSGIPDDPIATSASGNSDVAVLLDRLRSIPEIRADRLKDVGERLERSAYSTREAAEQTAAALLGSRSD